MFFCARKITYFQPREISREVTRGDFLILPQEKKKLDAKSSKTVLFCARKITYFQTRDISRVPPADISWYFPVKCEIQPKIV